MEHTFTWTPQYCFCHLKSSLSPKLCLLLLYFGTQWVTAARVNWIWMRHLTSCLPNWLTDWLFLSFFASPSVVSLARCLLTELLPISIRCYKVYLSICLRWSEFMVEWINDPQLWSHLFRSFSVHFLRIRPPHAFQSVSLPSGDIYLVMFACVSILTRSHHCCLVSPHFITCLTDLSVIKHSALLQEAFRAEQNARQLSAPQRICCHERDSFIYRSCPTVPRRQLPHAPENPTAVLSTSEKRAIDLAWAKPFDGNSPLIRYILEVSENSKSRNSQPCVQRLHPSICALYPLCQIAQL